MKSNSNERCRAFNRETFCDWFQTSSGLSLREVEVAFLVRAMRVGYNQRVLQLGALGWEDRLGDADLLSGYCVVDPVALAHPAVVQIRARLDQLPIATESIDVLIMVHTLEFESNQHQVVREAERVLKPEGQLLLLGFHPWSLHRIVALLSGKRKQLPWCGHFISRHRVHDWLGLLNFAVDDDVRLVVDGSTFSAHLFPLGYAINAVKRRYTLIPLAPVRASRARLIPLGVVDRSMTKSTL